MCFPGKTALEKVRSTKVVRNDAEPHIYWEPMVEITWAVCKVRGLTLLRRVVTLWRCGDGLNFEVPPLASDALLDKVFSGYQPR
jgi:hypothetical protein